MREDQRDSVLVPTDATGEGDILGHEGDAVGVGSTEVGVLEQIDHC
jgi:hypothetical protein